jgi:hypothetical protein
VREVLEILENIIAEAGALIESRSPELVAHARAALRRYADADVSLFWLAERVSCFTMLRPSERLYIYSVPAALANPTLATLHQ